MRLSLVPAQWPGDTFADVLRAVDWGTDAGVAGMWFSEVSGFDAIGLAVAAAPHTGDAELLVGPVSPAIRDPALLAMGLATVAAVARGPVHPVLGSSSPTIVSGWHGRPWQAPVAAIETAAATLRAIAAGTRTAHAGGGIESHGFVLRATAPVGMQIVIAAQGRRMLRTAGAIADRVVVNLVTPEQAAGMVEDVASGARDAARPAPPTSVWLAAGSVDESRPRVMAMLRGYIRAPGYRERFLEAGLLSEDSLMASAVDRLAVFGDDVTVARRIGEYAAAGLAEVALVVSGGDRRGSQTIEGAMQAVRSGQFDG